MSGERSLQVEHRPRPVEHRPHPVATRSTPTPPDRIIRTAHVLPVDADLGRVGNALTARIAATKRRLLEGGLLQPVSWGIPGPPDIRGRRVFTYFMLDALIDQRPALDRSTIDTDRADDIKVIILDPLAISDSHLFRWGEPIHVYSIKAIDGIIQNEETGVRFTSEVTVIR